MPRMSAARAAVQRALIVAGDAITVTVLADRLGQHQNTVREHLDKLTADGLVERLRSRPAGRGRPAWLYRAIGPSHSPVDEENDLESGGHEYAALAAALIEQVASSNPDPRGMARQAGERWGRTLAEQRLDHSGDPRSTDAPDPSGTVIDLLRDLRFQPEPAQAPHTHRLTTCPLLDAARRNPEVVCEVHLGIVRGVLDRLGGQPDGADLEAFAEPGACRLTLRPTP